MSVRWHDKNKKLLELLKPQLGTSLEVYFIGSGDLEQLIYPVNSKTPKKEDHQVVNQFRNAVSNICRSKENILSLCIGFCWSFYYIRLQLLVMEF